MKHLRRMVEVVSERASAVLAGSALWWVVEHLADKAISYAVHVIAAGVAI